MISLRDVNGAAVHPSLEQAYAGWLAEIGASRAEVQHARATLAEILAAKDILFLSIEREGQTVGFASVRTLASADLLPRRRLDELFVLPEMRRLGIGTAAARLLFDRFEGHWEIVSLQRDLASVYFWRQLLRRFPADGFSEERLVGETRYRFVSKGAR